MDLVEEFLRHLAQTLNASPQTVRCYRADLSEFREFLSHGLGCGRDNAILSLDHHVDREYLSHLYERGVSRATLARKLASLRSLFRHLARRWLTNSNPDDKLA